MANPISGDKSLSHYGLRGGNQTNDAHKPRPDTGSGAVNAPAQDRLETRAKSLARPAAPLSDAIQTHQQATDAVKKLLDLISGNPAQGMAAQGGISNNQANALLSSSAG